MQTGPITTSPPAATPAAMPLFHAAWLFAAGIVLAHWLWLRPSLVLIALALIAGLSCLAALRAQRIAWLPLAALWLLLGAWCALMEPQPAPAPALAALSDDLLRTVEGTVIDAGPIRNESSRMSTSPLPIASQRIDLRVATAEQVADNSDAQLPVSGRVRLTVRWPTGIFAPPQPFRCGERIRAVVRLLPPETYHDPGVWSRASYLLDQGITSTATVAIDRIEDLGPSRESLLACRLSQAQHAVTARLLALPAAMGRLPAPLRLTPDDAAMLAAMVAGDRTYLTHSLRVGFERTGSFHMLVVSGFHLAIVAGCIFWITRRLRLPRLPATLVTIAASFAYALFTGFATPVQRSLWMVTLYLLARLVYRQRSPLNVIGFAALCLLALSPRSLFDASLQMTLLAVIAIAGIAAPLLQATVHPYLTATRDLRVIAIDTNLAPRLAQFRVTLRIFAAHLEAAANRTIAGRAFPWTIRFLIRLVELVVISCVVELAMTLPMALYFHRITLFALPVNLLILPLLALLLPAALLMLLALLVWPAAAVAPAIAVAFLLHLGNGLVRLFGSLTLADLRIPTPLLWQSALFCALLAAAILLAHKSALRSSAGRSRWPIRAACAALLLAAIAAVAPRPIQHPRGALLVEAIDVGQGDSLLLITPGAKPSSSTPAASAAARASPPRTSTSAKTSSRPRSGRAASAILTPSRSPTRTLTTWAACPPSCATSIPTSYGSATTRASPHITQLLAQAASLRVRVRTFHAGDSFSFGQTQINVLAPFASYQPSSEPSNDDSLVLHVAYAASSVLLEGDAEAPVEDAMVAQADSAPPQSGLALASTLLKVGHHGSITSTRPEFLSRVSPQWAVISCGPHNRYGHPRQEVLDELETSHVRTLRTDVNGIVCFTLNGISATPDFACGSADSP